MGSIYTYLSNCVTILSFTFFPSVSLRCVLWMETSYLHQGFLLHQQSLNYLLNSSVQRQENSLKESK